MKKLASVFIVLLLALGLVGCSSNIPVSSTSTEARTEAPATKAPTTAASPTTIAPAESAEPTTETATTEESATEAAATEEPTTEAETTEEPTTEAAAAEASALSFLINVGDVVTFGHYEQDNNIFNGTEPIEWLVLSKNGTEALLISCCALDAQLYNTTYGDVTWETCSLRTWLNGTFLNKAFSAKEQKQIITSTVTAYKNPSSSTDPGNDTEDKLFLLNHIEAEKYFSSDNERICYPTEYAKAQGAHAYSSGACWWWLRSPGAFGDRTQDVDDNGVVNNYGNTPYIGTEAVRPALWVKLSGALPAFTEENIAPYNEYVTNLAYAVLQRGSEYSLSGSMEMTRSEAAACFRLDMDKALFEYSYRNTDLLLDPVFGGTYDAENNVKYCQTDQNKIMRTLNALLGLELLKKDFPEVYDSHESPRCIWNQNGLYLCLPMMGEAPGAVYKDLEFTEGKALLYADVFEPFNNVPTDWLVITLIPAENELGFTIESISLNPKAAADAGLGDGEYALWNAMQEVRDIKYAGKGDNLDVFEEAYTEGQEVTFTMKSSGRYIKFTKDYIETTFMLDCLENGGFSHCCNQDGELIRVPISPAVRDSNWASFSDMIGYYEWVFSEGACELFVFEVTDGMVTMVDTQS